VSIKKESQGVSPVIGVVIMLAITIIIGVVVAQFIFDVTERFSPSAEASFDFQQNLVKESGASQYNYTVTARATVVSNADYIAITASAQNQDSPDPPSYNADLVEGPNGDTLEPSEVDRAPDSPKNAGSIDSNNDGRIILRAGDRVTVRNLEAGDTVQAFASIKGEEQLVAEYTVQDVVPEAYGN
jgi:flagellin-like protein